jgi:putative redox protein
VQPAFFRKSILDSGNHELVAFTGGARLAAGGLWGMGLKGTKFGKSPGYANIMCLLSSDITLLQTAVLLFLRKMKKSITGCEISAKGLRKEEHPTGFKSISVDINLESVDVTSEDMKKVIALSEDKYCPVYAMLKGNTVIDISFKINASDCSGTALLANH